MCHAPTAHVWQYVHAVHKKNYHSNTLRNIFHSIFLFFRKKKWIKTDNKCSQILIIFISCVLLSPCEWMNEWVNERVHAHVQMIWMLRGIGNQSKSMVCVSAGLFLFVCLRFCFCSCSREIIAFNCLVPILKVTLLNCSKLMSHGLSDDINEFDFIPIRAPRQWFAICWACVCWDIAHSMRSQPI